ncbi:MAG: gamma-glutamyl-gamma-aminobutyrate hydrolase family protein [Chitinophagaceae bacterium]|nr:gamma-glutamyl-gamma-aminobutyrate hydrolase family protein [Rubrivivax sp.]
MAPLHARARKVARPPVVLVTSCNRVYGGHPFHVAGRKYVEAVRLAGALPLIAPPVAAADIEGLLAAADGVLLTGSPSNVHPGQFGEDVHNPALPLDIERDAWTLPLVRQALAMGMPLLAICRGAQEVNVALGGSLHQAVQELPGFLDHRDDDAAPIDVQYGPAHPVEVTPGGVLAQIVGESAFTVNSLHGQGVNRLAEGLRVEGRAPDGVVEAFSLPSASGFNLCLQWHPEWQAADNPVSMKILQAFGAAAQAWRNARDGRSGRGGCDTPHEQREQR